MKERRNPKFLSPIEIVKISDWLKKSEAEVKRQTVAMIVNNIKADTGISISYYQMRKILLDFSVVYGTDVSKKRKPKIDHYGSRAALARCVRKIGRELDIDFGGDAEILDDIVARRNVVGDVINGEEILED